MGTSPIHTWQAPFAVDTSKDMYERMFLPRMRIYQLRTTQGLGALQLKDIRYLPITTSYPAQDGAYLESFTSHLINYERYQLSISLIRTPGAALTTSTN